MPLNKFVLLLVIVIAAAGGTIWLASTVVARLQDPGFGWAILIPLALVVAVVLRVLQHTISTKENDHT